MSAHSVRSGLLAMFLAGLCPAISAATPLASGNIHPDFTLTRFNTSQQVNLYNDLSGKIVVLDFFAHWCGPCQTASSELEPQIQQYYASRGGNPAGIPVQLVSVNIQRNAVTDTQNYINTYGLDYVLDDPSWSLFNLHTTTGGIPRFAIVDGAANTNKRQWEVIWTQTGYGSGLYTSFRSAIDSVLKVPEPVFLFGDANRNGTVDVADLTLLLNNYNKSGMLWVNGDFNNDGTVNVADLTALLNNYNKTSGLSMAAPVPEPSSIAMLAGIALTAFLYGWRKRASAVYS
jgi:thiol-disulfide isomerase/thioredoxin